jgi:hypothetical protein
MTKKPFVAIPCVMAVAAICFAEERRVRTRVNVSTGERQMNLVSYCDGLWP